MRLNGDNYELKLFIRKLRGRLIMKITQLLFDKVD